MQLAASPQLMVDGVTTGNESFCVATRAALRRWQLRAGTATRVTG